MFNVFLVFMTLGLIATILFTELISAAMSSFLPSFFFFLLPSFLSVCVWGGSRGVGWKVKPHTRQVRIYL